MAEWFVSDTTKLATRVRAQLAVGLSTCYSVLAANLRGPQGFWGSGENGYLFSGSWGALIIIKGELGSKLIILGI